MNHANTHSPGREMVRDLSKTNLPAGRWPLRDYPLPEGTDNPWLAELLDKLG
jgi:hypothetical protein